MPHSTTHQGIRGRRPALLTLVVLLTAMPLWAQEIPKTIEVGVAWQGKSMMPERVLAGMQKTLAEQAPWISLETRKELEDLAALERAVADFEGGKQAMVIMRSTGAQLLGRRGSSIPSFIGAANNPVELGAAFAMDRPKPNICGVTYYIPARIKLDTFKQVYPPMKNFLLLVEDGHPGSPIDAEETAQAAPGLGLSGKTVSCKTIDDVLAAIKRAGEDVSIIIGSQALLMDNTDKLVEAAGPRPVFSYSERPVEEGALAGMVADDNKLGQMLGNMLIDVLVNNRPMAETAFQTDPEPRLRLNRGALERFKALIPFSIQSLAQTEQMLENILKTVPTGIGLVEDRVIIQVNDYVLDLTGYTREELIGQSARMLYPTQEEYDYVGREKYRQIARKGTGSVETRWQRKDGRIRHVVLSSTPLDSKDLSRGVTFTVIDITDRKLAESALLESEERFSKAFLSSPAPLVISEIATGRFIDVNDRCVDILGYSKDEQLGRTSKEVGIWSDPGERDRVIAKLEKDNGFRDEPITFITKSGAEKFVLWSAEIVNLAGKEVLLSMFIDDTDRKLAEEALAARTRVLHIAIATFIVLLLAVLVRLFISLGQRKTAVAALQDSEERYRRITAGLTDYIYTVKVQDGRVVETKHSPACETVTGYTAEELFEDPDLWIRLIAPEDRGRVLDRVREVFEGGKSTVIEHRIVRKDGEIRWVSYSTVPKVDAQGKLIAYDGVIKDITERKRAEEEREKLAAQLLLSQKRESIGVLAGGIAHDFNNILSAIIGYTEIAITDLPGESMSAEYLAKALKASDRAKNLIRQILTFSRQSETEVRPLRLEPTVMEALRMLRSSLPTSIEIHQSIEPDLPAVMADPTQVYQIVMNLCTNAAHAIKNEHGTIEVCLDEFRLNRHSRSHSGELSPGNYVRLKVNDTGTGMPPDIQERIFDPYFTTKNVGEGTGLGLAVVYGIVKKYRGAISVESELGKGTTFTVLFPVAEDMEYLDSAAADQTVLPSGREHILFVDDEPTITDLGKSSLERLGYKVTTRQSSVEALELFRNDPQRFDLVVTDMTMPHITGDELARKMLLIRPDLPIILCTGYSKRISEKSAKGMGIRAFVMKPISQYELAGRVRRVLDERSIVHTRGV